MATLIQSMQNLLSQKDPLLANETKRVILKEYLQAYTLDFLYNHPLLSQAQFLRRHMSACYLWVEPAV